MAGSRSLYRVVDGRTHMIGYEMVQMMSRVVNWQSRGVP